MSQAISKVTPVPVVDELTRFAVLDGSMFQYADEVRSGDLISADLSRTTISTGGGLYLVASDDGWRGCRRMIRVPGGIQIDQDGRGDWVTVPTLEPTGWRVIARVACVMRDTGSTNG